MFWILAIIAVIVVMGGFSASEPHPNSLTEPNAVPRALRLLLARGIAWDKVRGTLTICFRDQMQQSVIFEKYITDTGVVGFDAIVSRAPWSDAEYERIAAAVNMVRLAPVQNIDAAATLRVRLGDDVDRAHALARGVFEQALGADISRDCVAYFRDHVPKNSPKLTGVDDPDTDWG